MRDKLYVPSQVQSQIEPLVIPGTSELVIVMTDSRSFASLVCLCVFRALLYAVDNYVEFSLRLSAGSREGRDLFGACRIGSRDLFRARVGWLV